MWPLAWLVRMSIVFVIGLVRSWCLVYRHEQVIIAQFFVRYSSNNFNSDLAKREPWNVKVFSTIYATVGGKVLLCKVFLI